ncbi:MAG: hypothetical protein H6Q15_1249 [Bacteroidetes bacterium]|nr:hypothetical protein [Bacteroidota bacterium]
MISIESISKENIELVANKNKADKILVEKVIRALLLLEILSGSKLYFVFKGGTALMLLLNSTRRLSIDIDIIVPDKKIDIGSILNSVIQDKGFIRFEKHNREVESEIIKEHYKLFYKSSIDGNESNILLDVLFEEVHYTNVIELQISSPFCIIENDPNIVKVPNFNNIIADKLTAFAPNTTGIPYFKKDKEMGMEIIKQMYDIGTLFDRVDNILMVREVFNLFVSTEAKYRNIKIDSVDVLKDIYYNSLSICLRAPVENCRFEILNKGIKQIKSFIFSEQFHIEKAITLASRVAYLSVLIDKGKNEKIDFFNHNLNMSDWEIKQPFETKLNKLKKTNIEAFYYWYRIYELLQFNKH